MKTIKEFRDHFSAEEIKLLKEIVCGKLEFSVLEQQIRRVKKQHGEQLGMLTILLGVMV